MRQSIPSLVTLLMAAVLLASAGCDDGATTAPPTTPVVEADPIISFQETLSVASEGFDYTDGEFHDDFGDGAFFGVAFYARSTQTQGPADHDTRAKAANAYNLGVLAGGVADPLGMLDILEEVFMATLGSIEYAGVTGDKAGLPTIAGIIEAMDAFSAGFGDYLEVSAGEFALDLYGPTAATAGLALIHLQHAHFFADNRDKHVARGVAIVEAIDSKAWDAAGKRYKYRPDNEELYLYPNATMLTVVNRLFELTGEQKYLDRAEALFEGIQPLRKTAGYYQSPYSQVYQGAQTDEYGTLSAQNYLTLGLLITHENTGDAKYLDEALTMLDFVRVKLWDEAVGKLLHHWIDDRAATTDDPDYFCSGCNMQYLYIGHYLQHQMGWGGRPQ